MFTERRLLQFDPYMLDLVFYHPLQPGLMFIAQFNFRDSPSIQGGYDPHHQFFEPLLGFREPYPVLFLRKFRNITPVSWRHEVDDFHPKTIRHVKRRKLGATDGVNQHGESGSFGDPSRSDIRADFTFVSRQPGNQHQRVLAGLG